MRLYRVGKLYFTKNPNKRKKNYFFRCVYGGRGGARVSEFFFTKNPNKKKNFLFFARERGGGGG